jgi:uncharacterized membrane protein YfhO
MAVEGENNPVVAKIVIEFSRNGRISMSAPKDEILTLGLLQKAISTLQQASAEASRNIQIVPPMPGLDKMGS